MTGRGTHVPSLVMDLRGVLTSSSESVRRWRRIGVAAAAGPGQNGAVVTVIELKATKYKFTPDTVDIPVGTTVQFKITAVDHEHGFEIAGVKDSCVQIPQGETKTVEYKAEKAGKISFKCCHVCGIGHAGMHGSMTVR